MNTCRKCRSHEKFATTRQNSDGSFDNTICHVCGNKLEERDKLTNEEYENFDNAERLSKGCNTVLTIFSASCGDISFSNKIIYCEDCKEKAKILLKKMQDDNCKKHFYPKNIQAIKICSEIIK